MLNCPEPATSPRSSGTRCWSSATHYQRRKHRTQVSSLKMVYITETSSGFTPFHASIVSVLYTISYVGVLYLSPLSRPHPNLPRDSPSVIRVRIRAVTVVTIVTLVVTSSITAATTSNRSLFEVLSFLGLSPAPSSVADILRSLLLTAILFTGPLVQRLCFDNGWRDIKDDVNKMFYTWTGWRNYVAVCCFLRRVFFLSSFQSFRIVIWRISRRISPPRTV